MSSSTAQSLSAGVSFITFMMGFSSHIAILGNLNTGLFGLKNHWEFWKRPSTIIINLPPRLAAANPECEFHEVDSITSHSIARLKVSRA